MRYFVAIAACALLTAACSGQSQTSDNSTSATPPASSMATNPPNVPSGSMTIQILAQNGSGESGTATLTPMGSRTRIVIGIKGEKLTGKQPAHVHKGTCAKLNPAPVYPLHDVVLGKSNTVIDVPLHSLTAAPMAINVHESAANVTKYVACGAIVK